MPNSSRFLAGALALVAGAIPFSGAATPDVRMPNGILILENERTLDGSEIELSAGCYHVRRSTGETVVSADKVLFLAANQQEAYQYLRRRANLRDPDERLRLARWCRERQLRAEALEEAQAALALRPGHGESQRLVQSLREAPAAPVAVAPDAHLPNGTAPAVDVGPEVLNQFCRRVQPILMNTCARCHAAGRGGAFQLTWTYDNSLSNRKTIAQNLAAVLAQINPERPEVSPLLTKASSAHGDCAQPPLRGRTITAFRTLEEWVRLAARDLPATAAVNVADAAPTTVPAPSDDDSLLPETSFAAPVSEEEPRVVDAPHAEPAGPLDEFDPLIFNRQMHPMESAARNGPRR